MVNNNRQRIFAETLIPGAGEPSFNMAVIIADGIIEWVGPQQQAPQVVGDDLQVPVLMPGMWDCHTHFTGMQTPALAAAMDVPVPVAAARSVADAQRAIDAGFTSVREVGGFGVYLARVINEGNAIGPHVYAAGDLISPTGGHADLHNYSLGCVADLAARDGWLHTCDGVSGALRAVRLQLRKNAKLLKICASGGTLTEYDDPMHQQFSDIEIRTMVEEAARAERIVAAHCHGKAGIMAALRNGVKTIEHGTFLDEEAADAMLETGAILVTTRSVKIRNMAYAKTHGLPDYAWEKLLMTADRHREAVSLAIEKGVIIAAGTDSLTSGDDTPLRWGEHALELKLLVDDGMTPLQAIESATATAPLTLGPQAPKTGQIKAGYDADLCAVTHNPVSDIKVLLDTKNITHVWKAGTLLKQPQ